MLAPEPIVISHRYVLLDPLGNGGMGIVYRAQDRMTGQTVALKRVHIGVRDLEFGSQTDELNPAKALAQEFKILASLRHPHIISVLDFGFDVQHWPYYTMLLLDGATRLTVASEARDTPAVIDLLLQLLQALAYLHRRGFYTAT